MYGDMLVLQAAVSSVGLSMQHGGMLAGYSSSPVVDNVRWLSYWEWCLAQQLQLQQLSACYVGMAAVLACHCPRSTPNEALQRQLYPFLTATSQAVHCCM